MVLSTVPPPGVGVRGVSDRLRHVADVGKFLGEAPGEGHYGRFVCLHCPADHHDPPFIPFRFRSHIRYHLRRNPDHVIALWCFDHRLFEEAFVMPEGAILHPATCDPILVSLETGHPVDAGVIDLAIEYRQAQLEEIQAEIEALRRSRLRIWSAESDG